MFTKTSSSIANGNLKGKNAVIITIMISIISSKSITLAFSSGGNRANTPGYQARHLHVTLSKKSYSRGMSIAGDLNPSLRMAIIDEDHQATSQKALSRSKALPSTNTNSKIGFPLFSDRASSLDVATTNEGAINQWDDYFFAGLYRRQDGAFVSYDKEAITAILTSSMLITGNTVGASMMILPDTASDPGMALSIGIFFGEWILSCSSFLVE